MDKGLTAKRYYGADVNFSLLQTLFRFILQTSFHMPSSHRKSEMVIKKKHRGQKKHRGVIMLPDRCQQ